MQSPLLLSMEHKVGVVVARAAIMLAFAPSASNAMACSIADTFRRDEHGDPEDP